MWKKLMGTAGALTLAMSIFIAEPAVAAACGAVPAVAHRFGSERFVENTEFAAEDTAGVRGVKVWETDVRFTSDNVPVIMHDPDVNRTTDGTGNVADHTFAEIEQMQTSDGQGIPTLKQMVGEAYVYGARVLVELKVNPTDAQWTSFLAAMNSRPMTTKLVITSFDTATLAEAKTKAAAYQRGLIQDVGDVDPAAVTPYASILIKHHNSVTSDRVTKWVNGGLQVYAWTVDYADGNGGEWQRMNWLTKLSGVITDEPGGYLAWQKGC